MAPERVGHADTNFAVQTALEPAIGRAVIHRGRDGDAIATRILGSGPLRLDPPGLLDLRVKGRGFAWENPRKPA